VLGSVLYVAAHPDDENTAVLSYYSSGELLRTGYLSVTRGDGGQNLIGNEQAELLGVLRTQELLEARKIDGAEQFFTRAIDFGYSKSPEETMEIWGKEEVFSDFVWIIRNFRPDVIITRFSSSGEGTHGHHTASAILAEQAFHLAGDSTKFPDQLKYVDVWQPKRIAWNGWLQAMQNRNVNLEDLIKIDVGSFNPLLGKSYTEIAALSRSMHKSQGFGASGRRGETIHYFLHLEGQPAENNLFENIDLSWKRVPNSEKVSKLLKEAEENFNPENPGGILPVLLEAYKELNRLEESYWVKIKKTDLAEVIKSASGIWLEAIANDFAYSPGSNIEVTNAIVNRSGFPFKLKSIKLSYLENDTLYNQQLNNGEFFSRTFTYKLPENISITHPYWLNGKPTKGLYSVADQLLIGKPENQPSLIAEFIITADDVEIPLKTSVLFTWTDQVEGEKYRPVEIRPKVNINPQDNTYLFPSNKSKEIILTVKNNFGELKGKIKLNVPSSWKVEPEEEEFSFTKKAQELNIKFAVTPPEGKSEVVAVAEILLNNEILNRKMITVSYNHILTQTIFPKTEIKFIRLETEKVISNIGYITGSGDDIPKYLEQLGYNVTILSDNQLENGSLQNYNAIVTGIRAYNTRERLSVLNEKLLNYVYNGGTLVVQYNVTRSFASRGTVTENIGPFPFTISRNRVADENSEIYFINKNHKTLNYPNKISLNDFEGWIQERGLYFADKSNPHYETIIAMNDPGEAPLDGGIIYTKYGKGTFIYTGLSFFRQLPAGVPGAFRLFINLISSGAND
jgi:LmbE family N-acetylglucosaminyl deacetylase